MTTETFGGAPYSITVTPRGVTVQFEVGSLDEAIGILQDNEAKMRQLVAIPIGTTSVGVTPDTTTGSEADSAAAGKGNRRSRKSNQPDPATATAPPAVPVPVGAASLPVPAPVPALATTEGLAVPAFLDRTNPSNVVTGAVTAAAPAPVAAPPPMPAAPSIVPPAAPPTGVLASKVIEECKRRATGSADGGAALVAWLASPGLGLVIPSASFDEAMECLRFVDDAKIAPAAGALGIS